MDATSLYADDPSATYRGYRRQALYCLFRLFDDGLPSGATLQPEGHEDLAVRDSSGNLTEVVQVKDHSENLTASTFKPSFYRRIAPFCESGSLVKVRIVSFGPIGPELLRATQDRDNIPARVLNTLTKERKTTKRKSNGTDVTVTEPGLPVETARAILGHIRLETAAEDDLVSSIMSRLEKIVTAGAPVQAMRNLMWWLITSAESQAHITTADARDCLDEIGQFVAHRQAHSSEWNTSIIPIAFHSDDRQHENVLRGEFFKGGRVRVAHIAADLDVLRPQFLNDIHSGFTSANVVVLHSASGQGKTTLAYRYLLDMAPEDFRFEILTACDVIHARHLAAAIVGHSAALRVPTLVFVDVRPGDSNWVEVVREISGVAGIQVLVAIREEDWQRANASRSDFAFTDVVLEFTESEASQLFSVLHTAGYGKRFLNFDEAWAQFGHRKTLFEFIYFVTQEETLADRVRVQVRALLDAANENAIAAAEIRLLRCVAVATAYEARLVLAPFVKQFAIPAPERTLARFNEEYLLRTTADEHHIEGFHSIRSLLICDELIDESLNSWSDTATECLPFLNEADLGAFLLCAFSRHSDESERLTQSLCGLQLGSWSGVRGVSHALMWNGLRKYRDANLALVAEVRERCGDGWVYLIDCDIAGVFGPDGFDFATRIGATSDAFSNVANAAADFRARQKDKDTVFAEFRTWARSNEGVSCPVESESEFSALSEALYWIGHLDVESKLRQVVTDSTLDAALALLPIYRFALVAVAVQKCDGPLYAAWLESNRAVLEQKLRQEAALMAIVTDGEAIIGHFAIDLDQDRSLLRTQELQDGAAVSINDLAVERVTILARCLPGKQYYGAAGYGHRMSLVSASYDESVKRMPVENVAVPWLPRFNSIARGLFDYQFRPQSWQEYFSKLQTLRENVVASLDELTRSIAAFHKTGRVELKDPERWDESRNAIRIGILFPTSAIDEWGFVSESAQLDGTEDVISERFQGVARMREFRDATNEYLQTVGNFLDQAVEAFHLIPQLRGASDLRHRARLIATARKLGVNEQSIRLSVVYGVDCLKAVTRLHELGTVVTAPELSVERQADFFSSEAATFEQTMRIWCSFTYPDGNTQRPPSSVKRRSRPRKTRRRRNGRSLTELLAASRNRLKNELGRLKRKGIVASILTEKVSWNDESAIRIAFDTRHPLSSIMAIEEVCTSIRNALLPDQDRIVRRMVTDLYWPRIVGVPLVGGKCLEASALPNLKAVTYEHLEVPDQIDWRILPEPIPDDALHELKLVRWDSGESFAPMDRLVAAYSAMFQHVEHMADFARCDAELDELGMSILQSYLSRESERAHPIFQEALDSGAALFECLPEINEELATSRPNLFECIQLLIDLQQAILPTEDFETEAKVTIDEVVAWRDRMKEAFGSLGVARYLWIADALGFEEFNGG